jgi:hypothetical protein
MQASWWVFLVVIEAAGCAARHPKLPMPMDVEPDRGICVDLESTYECAETIEKHQLNASRGIVSRRDAQICFRLTDGGETCVSNENPSEESNQKLFLYLGTLPQPAEHVLWVQYYEGSEVMLIDAASGRKHMLDAVPVPSPDGVYLAVASADVAYGANRVSIWTRKRDTLEMVWSLEPDPNDWSPGRVQWVGSALLEVPRIRYEEYTGKERIIDTIRIGQRGGKWQVVSN